MTESILATRLQQGCAALSLSLSQKQQTQLLQYIQLLHKWNKVYNLTSVREPEQMLGRHILDSLSILPYLVGDSLLDVGTGGGLPGIPVAIARPEMAVTLLDSNSKKTRFLQQVKTELALNNVTVVHGRVEQISLPQFAIITARAFASIDDIIKLTGHHCQRAGKLILMKGVYPTDELEFDATAFELQDVISLHVPESQGERHLVRLCRKEG